MAIHRFQTADGKIHRVEAADRATAEAELNRALGKRTAGQEVMGAITTLNRSIPFADEAADLLQAGSDVVSGRSKPAEAWANARSRSKAASHDFETRRPTAANLVKGVGLAAQAVPVGGTAVPVAAGVRGLMGSSARAATAAGLGAQAAGYGGEGTLRQRAKAANDATPLAMGVGAALPVAVAGAGAARRGVANAGRKTGTVVARSANRASGGKLLDARTEAAKRLGEALKADGLGPQEIRGALQEWQASGASSPALMDLAGENTRALLRSAASKPGGARNAAVEYANQVTGDLQDNVVDRAYRLTPQAETADDFAAGLKRTQSRLATEQYREPYQTRVALGDDVLDVLQDEPGKAALRSARADALERRDMAQVAEIDSILKPPTAEPGVVELPAVARPDAPAPVEDPRGSSSLLTFLRQQGGLRDEGGDLAAMDLHRDRGRFQKDWLVNPNGIDIDDAAQRAWEAGYFPDAKLPGGADVADNYHPVDRQMMLDAIRREVAGQPIADDWVREQDLAASTRWMDDADGMPETGDDYWRGLEAERGGQEMSAGTLDRVRIALGERGDKLTRAGNRSRGGGSFQRKEVIDRVLDQVPELSEARGTYRKMQAQRDAVEIGQGGLRTPADRYRAALAAKTDISPEARGAAGVGYRQSIVDAVGNPASGSTGLLNRLASSRNQRSNLAETFGEEEADLFRGAVQNEVDRVANARFISPNTGSQTALREADDALIDLPPMTKVGIAKALFDKLRRGVTLTDDERQALLEIGTTLVRSGDDLPKLPTTPQAMRLLSPAQRARLSSVLAAGAGAQQGQAGTAR